jgi:hypothetical protein
LGADPFAARLLPPPCIGEPPAATPLVRYNTLERQVWVRGIRGQLQNHTVAHVAYALSNYGDKHGHECHPGVELLAADACCAERTVIRAVNWLLEFGFLHLYRKGARKLGQANEYHLALPAMLAAEQYRWKRSEAWWTADAAQRHMNAARPEMPQAA